MSIVFGRDRGALVERRRFGGGEPAAGRPDNNVPAARLAGVGHSRWADLARSPAPFVPDPHPLVHDVELALRTAALLDEEELDLDVGLDIFTEPPPRSRPAERAEPVTTLGRSTGGGGSRRRGGPRGRGPGGGADAAEHPARPPRRVAGRHAAGPRRGAWESRYLGKLLVVDLTVGVAVAAVAYGLRSRELATVPGRAHFLLPVALVVALGLAGSYERRFLFVGAEECRRVIRAGLSLMATAIIVSYTVQVPLARSYVLIALPAATMATAAMRAFLRHRLWRCSDRGEPLHWVTIVGRSAALARLTDQTRREYAGSALVLQCSELPAERCATATASGPT